KGTNDLATGFGGAAVGTYTGFTTAGATDCLDTGFPLATTPRRFLRLEISAP
ncbi:MAG: hypothetical protein H7067_01955, partial [Burkholderiales bacterium]|nr:hypothetical protein [Opitutaceae bacterium]